MPPTYYRGCWHVVSRGFLVRYRQTGSSRVFFPNNRVLRSEDLHPHAALLHQAFAHCGRFPTAASRRSLGRVSVPVWPVTLSGRLPHRRLGRPLPHQLANAAAGPSDSVVQTFHRVPCGSRSYPVLATSFPSYPSLSGRLPTCYSPVRR